MRLHVPEALAILLSRPRYLRAMPRYLSPQALAILLSCLASVPLFDFSPNRRFWGGASLVITSIFLYAWAPKLSPYVAVADAGGPK